MRAPLTVQMWDAVAESRTVFESDVVVRDAGLVVLEISVPAPGPYTVRVEVEKQQRLVLQTEGAVT